ncbi:MAG TPA: GHKL domain-containing protein [Candidatus Hungatella pullicola]|nr:GHKL domain-containing protein [Candidatus Hungatella pullicola]
MLDIFTTLSSNLFRTFILKKFMTIFFAEESEKDINEKLVYISFFAVTSFIHLMFHFPPANILTNIFMIYVVTQIYKGDKKKKILITILIYGINMICDVISVYSFANYIVGEEYSQISPYVTVLLISVCEFIIERFVIKKRYAPFTPPYWYLLILIPLVSIGILFVLLMNNLNNRIILITVSAGILYINMLIFYLYNAIMSAYLKLEENNLFERQVESYANQLDVLMLSEEKNRALRHDMKHHLNELMMMATNHKDDEIIEYIENMQMFMTNAKEYINSGNKGIDSILNYMLSGAKENLAKVEYKINIPKEIKIRPFDLNVIFGNLLENAIEAAKNSERKWLSLWVHYKKGILFIEIKNSYNQMLKKRGNSYLSTKEEVGEHGIGLQNVSKIVSNYHGSMQISDENNIFDVKIILYTTFDE